MAIYSSTAATNQQGAIGQDPISGQSTLSYILPFQVIPGDVVLTEPATGQTNDIIRFGGGEVGVVYFFSDPFEPPEPGVLADGPLPVPQANSVVLTEVGPEAGPNGYFGYQPGHSLPGGTTVFSQVPNYDFYSDGLAPEPSSFAVLALGGLLAFNKRRAGRS